MIRNLLRGISSGFCNSFKALPDLLFLKHALECNENIRLHIYREMLIFKCKLWPKIMGTLEHNYKLYIIFNFY